MTASIVYDLGNYEWRDADWMEARAKTNWYEKPISIYEVHLGSWQRNVDEGPDAELPASWPTG